MKKRRILREKTVVEYSESTVEEFNEFSDESNVESESDQEVDSDNEYVSDNLEVSDSDDAVAPMGRSCYSGKNGYE